jgi:hypothetical protein
MTDPSAADNSASGKRNPIEAGHHDPVHFHDWKRVLWSGPLPPATKALHTRAVLAFLHYCKDRRCPATITIAKHYLEHGAGPGHHAPFVREGLRWFFRQARQKSQIGYGPQEVPAMQTGPVTDRMLPTLGAQDPGNTEWEQALVTAIRRRGFLWRTEQTYRVNGFANAVT